VEDPIIQVKFFTPWSSWTWYAIEYDGADLFFGFVIGGPWQAGHEAELGYFSLAELTAVRGPGGIRIERDLYFEPVSLSEVRAAIDARAPL
jgi:DUF2958 family protein